MVTKGNDEWVMEIDAEERAKVQERDYKIHKLDVERSGSDCNKSVIGRSINATARVG